MVGIASDSIRMCKGGNLNIASNAGGGVDFQAPMIALPAIICNVATACDTKGIKIGQWLHFSFIVNIFNKIIKC